MTRKCWHYFTCKSADAAGNMKAPSMRMWTCSLTPPLGAELGQTPVWPHGWYYCFPPSRVLPCALREGCCCAAGGIRIRPQSSDLCRSSWTRSLLGSPGVGAGFCTQLCSIWWDPCQRLGNARMALSSLVSSSPWRCARSGADGDMQNREINKSEFEYDQSRSRRSFR